MDKLEQQLRNDFLISTGNGAIEYYRNVYKPPPPLYDMEEIIKNGKTIVYLDSHGDLCLGDIEEITLCVGSQHKITINKLFGPICVKDLKIVFEGSDWNVRNKINQLKKTW